MNIEEKIAKAWYLKMYLKQLEKLLIEEQCHTSNDSQAFKQLLDLIERDTPKKVLDRDLRFAGHEHRYFFEGKCPTCSDWIRDDRNREFCDCGQRLDWSEK